MAQSSQAVRQRVFRLLRGGQELTRQEIAAALSLSMPTTLQSVTELAEEGILEECGAVNSSGGRRAKKIRLRPQAGQAVGIHISARQVELVVTDLLGGLQQNAVIPLPFRDQPDWYLRLQQVLLLFLNQNRINPRQILGVGVSFPGIIDNNGGQIVQSHALGLEHTGLERFRKALPFPAVFANDANCACFAERGARRGSCLYLALNDTVGGAVMLNGELWLGDASQAGELGHMLLIPGGRLCYCGKQGCADAYLSVQALEQDGWKVYLDHLSIFLTNLRMLMSTDLVIGGQAGAQIEHHLGYLRRKAAQYDRFARDVDYIHLCARRESACAAGAAGLALEAFADRALQK